MTKKEILQAIIDQKGWCGDPNGKFTNGLHRIFYPCKEGVCPIDRMCYNYENITITQSQKARLEAAVKKLNDILVEEILLGEDK